MKSVENLIDSNLRIARDFRNSKKAMSCLKTSESLYKILNVTNTDLKDGIRKLKKSITVNPKSTEELMQIFANVLYNINFLRKEYNRRKKIMKTLTSKEDFLRLMTLIDLDKEINRIRNELKREDLSKEDKANYRIELRAIKEEKKVQDELISKYIKEKEFSAAYFLNYINRLNYNRNIAEGILKIFKPREIKNLVDDYINKYGDEAINKVLNLEINDWGSKENHFIKYLFEKEVENVKTNPLKFDLILMVFAEEFERLMYLYGKYLSTENKSYLELSDGQFGIIYGMLSTLTDKEIDRLLLKNFFPTIRKVFLAPLFPLHWDSIIYTNLKKEQKIINEGINIENSFVNLPSKSEDNMIKINPLGEKGGATTSPQSIRFDKDYWTKLQVKRWLKDKGYNYGRIEEMENWWSARQFNPDKPPVPVRGYKYATIGKGIEKLKRHGIRMLVGIRKGAPRLNTSRRDFEKLYEEERKEHPSFSNKQITQIVKDHIKKTELNPCTEMSSNPVIKDGVIKKIKKIIDTRKYRSMSYPSPTKKEINSGVYILDSKGMLFDDNFDFCGIAKEKNGVLYFGELGDFHPPV